MAIDRVKELVEVELPPYGSEEYWTAYKATANVAQEHLRLQAKVDENKLVQESNEWVKKITERSRDYQELQARQILDVTPIESD